MLFLKKLFGNKLLRKSVGQQSSVQAVNVAIYDYKINELKRMLLEERVD